MYVILAILYESYIHPITVLSTLPTAHGRRAGDAAGCFGERGVALRVHRPVHADGHREEERHHDRRLRRSSASHAGETAEKAIHDASMDRFRPILMTTLAAVMGAVPIALGWGADGERRRPLGLVIVGGLLVSQFITLSSRR